MTWLWLVFFVCAIVLFIVIFLSLKLLVKALFWLSFIGVILGIGLGAFAYWELSHIQESTVGYLLYDQGELVMGFMDKQPLDEVPDVDYLFIYSTDVIDAQDVGEFQRALDDQWIYVIEGEVETRPTVYTYEIIEILPFEVLTRIQVVKWFVGLFF